MRHTTRRLAAIAYLASVLVAFPAGAAQKYLMTGKYARSAGVGIDLPLIGNNPGGVPNCGYTTESGVMIPGMSPIHQGFRSAVATTMVATPPFTPYAMVGTMTVPWRTMFANPHGCISLAGKLTATAAGAGKAFHFPTMVISKPLPDMTIALRVPLLPSIIQLASSAYFTGPVMSIPMTGDDAPAGTMNDGMNTAKFRYFHKSAWLSQTGRAGAKFTWCFGNDACTMVSQAMGVDKNGDPNFAYPVHQVFMKYTPGVNKFGGTMSHVASTGPNPSSLAVSIGGVLQFLGIAIMGSQATGRGYADFLTDPIMGGPAWANFMTGKVYIPEIMETQYLITTVMTPVPGTGSMATAANNKLFGFPFTTGTVLARNTGTDVQKNPVVVTLTGMGGDVVTAMGARNISLVAGGVAAVDALGTETPYMVQVFMPEPGTTAALCAGAVALLAVAAARARSVRAR